MKKEQKGNSRRTKMVVEPTWFPKVDGVFNKGEYIDVNAAANDRLFIRYSPIADSGVELERIVAGATVWRVHTAPLGVDHSKYTHDVMVCLETRFMARFASGRRYTRANPNGLTGRILIHSFGARRIGEVRDLTSGELLSRSVSEKPVLTRHMHSTPR